MTVGQQFIKEDFSSVYNADGEFSEIVVLSWKGIDYNITGIFDDTFIEFNADGSPITSDYSRISFEENLLFDSIGETPTTSEEENSFKMNVRGQNYRVYAPEKDGAGLIVYNLKKS